MPCSTRDTEQRFLGSWGVLSHVLLLEPPTGLDRVEVVGVRREVDDANPSTSAQGHDLGVVVSLQVVENQNVAALEAGEQFAAEPIHKPFRVGGLEHCTHEHPACEAHRPKQGQVVSPVHGGALDELGAPFYPNVTSGHRSVQPRFVEENELLDWHALDQSLERFTLDDDVRPELLQRPEAFFFTTYPARYRARLMLETWRRSRPRLPRLYAAVISPAFPSPSFARTASSSFSEMSDRFPPHFFLGLRCPSRRNWPTQRLMLASPTLKRFETVAYEPSPDSYASTTLCRSSIGCASAIRARDQTSILWASGIDSIEQWG